ncbi:Uncharacterized protein conserved in bacteria [Shewanella putrefaciens]|nr:Uncharacterized protein conserved in bacteria [Shewanella putrefaciens]
MQLPQTQILNTFSISRFNEIYLPSVNRNVFETLDSKTLYKRHLNYDFNAQDQLHIFIGLDSGLLANYILNQPLSLGCRYLFVELPEILELLSIELTETQKKQVDIVSPTDFEKILESDALNIFIEKDQFTIHMSLASRAQHLVAYTQLKQELTDRVEKLRFTRQIGFNQQIFVNVQLSNIADNRFPASVLRNQFAGKTCVVVAGGPSLDQHMNWLKNNADSFIVIAVSRIAAKLHRYGIQVDMVVNVDPQYISFFVSRDIFTLPKNTLLVQAHHSCSLISGQWPGPILYTGSRFPWNNKKDSDNIQTVGPTVSNCALNIAIEMGFKQILLSGIDFCYSKSGFTHTEGTLEQQLGPNLSRISEWVETYEGYLAETPIQLLQAMKDLQEQVSTYPNIDFINLSSSAAKIKGIKYQSLDEIKFEPIETRSINNLPENAFSVTSLDEKLSDLVECKLEISNTLKVMKEILKNTKKAIDLCKKLRGMTQLDKEVIKKINAIESKIIHNKAVYCQLIKFYGYAEFSKFLSSRNTENWTQSHINKMTNNYYNAYEVTTLELIKNLKYAEERIDCRISEITNKSPLNILAASWKKYNTTGRIHFWKALHKNDTSSCKVLINELELLFTEQCSQDPTFYKTALKENSNIELILQKIMFLKANGHSYGLNQLIINLSNLIDINANYARLYYLALSFKLNLDKKPKEALDALLKIDSNFQTEVELKQIILLSLQQSNLELAGSTLIKISQYSDEYLPQYAHVLRLQGQHQAAINTYLDYLDKYPSDSHIWLKLGLFMIDINQTEAALTAFSNALNADPHNELAKQYVVELKNTNNN